MSSLQSLLSEANQIKLISQRQRMREGEALFFGGNVPVNNRKRNFKQEQVHSESPMVQAIVETRGKIASFLQNAPKQHGHGSNTSYGNKKTPRQSESERLGMSDLKAEIEELRLDNQKIKNELNNVKNIVENLKFVLEKSPIRAEIPDAKNGEISENDIDLFGSSDEEEDAEKERIKEERVKAYTEKKAKKPDVIAKSSVIFDVKPWEDTTDMGQLEKSVRSVHQEGLVWGGGKLIPLAYGIRKLQIICVIEDDKVSVEDLIEKITGDFEEYVSIRQTIQNIATCIFN